MTDEQRDQGPVTSDDPRVTRALEEYLAAVEAGQRPDREAFLARDPAIAEALAECLDGLDFLRVHASRLAPSEPPAAESHARQPLGDYRIVREVGRGGMGVVYEAIQLSLGRRVALKVLPFAATLDPKQLQRFKNEAQAAANLHHPHIVPVYAFGCERGVHFYAMQFIDGQTLAAMIENLRGEAAPSDSKAVTRSLHVAEEAGNNAGGAAPTVTTARLSTVQAPVDPSHFRTVARFGLQAAEALEHAHQLGVVHRDIKPANLLLDGHGQVWIADFGLARVANDNGMTMTGDLIGTLRYMSPEQASAQRGLVDHRTDIYSLGATLYELLTLQPVFDAGERTDLLRQIVHDDPVPPRRLRRDIPADLETIVLKALEKSVTERYATAQELADDLRRFIEDKPILARRPSPFDRLGKWSRRHRSLIGFAVAILFIAVISLAVSTVLVLREQALTQAAYEKEADARAKEEVARTKEAEARARAEENFRQARRAVDYISQVAIEDMADDPRLRDIRKKLLEAALEYYKDFNRQQHDDPQTQAELAASHYRVAKILGEIGRQDEAPVALDQARRIMNNLVEKYPAVPEYNGNLFAIENDLGVLQEGMQLRLLRQKPVQEDLKLNDEQVRKLNQLADRRREMARGLNYMTPQNWRQKMEEMQAIDKAVVEVLQPDQQRRLDQLLFQQRGVRVFADANVVQALRLSAEQAEKIASLQAEVRRAIRNAPAARADKDSQERILRVLTPDQQAKWNELNGEPFRGVLLPSVGSYIGVNIVGGTNSITINGRTFVGPPGPPTPAPRPAPPPTKRERE